MKKISICILLILSAVVFLLNGELVSAKEGEKTVYLTFDDGPSPHNTENILNLLIQNNVKASFFVVGDNVQKYPEIVVKMNKNNMDIYPHCNNHTYKELYSSKEYYFNDLEICQNLINRLSGKNLGITFLRFPGGSDNTVGKKDVLMDIKEELIGRGIVYVDWNVDSGDATAARVSTELINKSIVTQGLKHNVEVVLMHDLENKNTTYESLQSVIDEYKKLGYTFKTFSEMEPWEKEYLINRRVLDRK